jgi:hypothetical protein
MAVGRISGPLLKSNLLRNGENLAFETDLLYLNVTDPSSANYKVGIKTSNPAYTLDINGTTRTTNLLVPTAGTFGGEVYISSSGISSLAGDLVLQAATGADRVKLNSNLYVDGTITATGDIVANGNITLGNQTTDTVTFGAEVNSDILPTTIDTYNLGSALNRWNSISVKTANIAVLNASGVLTVTDSTQSTSTSTGSIVTAGGVGIAKNTWIGGTLNVAGGTTLAAVNATSVTDSGLTATRVTFAGTGGLLSDSSAFTFNNSTSTVTITNISATAITSGNITNSNLTSGRVTYATTSGLLTDSANLTFNGTILTVNAFAVTNDATVGGTLGVTGLTTLATAKVSNLTSGRVVLAGASGTIQDSANLTFDGTKLTVTGNQQITGNLQVDGNITLGGNITIGDNVVDTVTVNADFTSDLIPKTDNTYNIGSTTYRWKKLWANTLDISGVSTLTGAVTASDTLSVAGDFKVNTNKFTVQASSGNTLVAGTLNVTGGSQFAAVDATNGHFTGIFQVDGQSTLGSMTAGGTTLSSLAVTTTASVGTSLTVGTTLGVTGATTLSTVSTSGLATLNSLSVTNNALISGTLSAGATTVSSATVSNLTNTRLVLAGTSGALTDSNKLTFDGTILTVTANATISGNLNVDGNITLGGNISIGDNVLDTVTVTADFTSDLIPKTTNTYNLGSTSLRWKSLNANTVDVSGASTLTGDITAGGKLNVTGLTTLSTLTTTGLATLNSASITNDTSVGGNLTVTGTTSFTGNIIGNLIPNANGTQNIGSYTNYWNNLYASGTANIANFQFATNTFSVTNTNGSITLQPNGTGNVIISSTKSLQIPVGNVSARPGTPANGMIRYNSELTQYEGYSAGNWSSLGGVRSVDGNAYIIAETSPGAGDDILHFYAGATASTNVGNWSNTALTILSPGFRVPTGNTAARPTGVDGYIRFNTEINKFEGFANTVWSSLGGVSSTSGTTYIGAEAYPGAGDNTLYFYANGVQQATISPTATTVHNLLNVDNTTNSVSTTTGAIVTAGGIGIAKNLYVGINANIAGTLTSSSDVTFNGANAAISFAPTGTGSITINPSALGSINNMSVGATTASTGRFTTLTATTSATFSPSGTVTINPTTQSTMDNVSIGSTTRAPGAFTTLASNGLTTFTDTTASTSSSSGALVVTGGTGVGGNLYVGGNINSTGTITAGSTLTANAAVNLNPANFNVSIAPTGTGTATINPASVGTINNMSIGATTRGTGAFTTLTSNNATTFTAGTASTTTTSGTVVVTGGVGVSGAVNIGGAISAAGATFTSVTDSGLTAGRVTFAGTGGLLTDDTALTYSTGTLTVGTSVIAGGVTVGNANITLTGGNITGAADITATGTVQALSLKATNLTSGRVTYAGTSGVLQDSANLTFNGTTLTVNAFAVTNDATIGGTLGVTGATTLSNTLGVTGITSITNTTDSSSTSTGALKVLGGVGIVKNLYVGGNSNIAGTETVTGTFTANGAVNLSPANFSVTISPTGTGSVTINPNTLGAIDNIAVGANSRASGAFTTLASNGNATLSGNGSIVSLTPSGAGYVTINPGAVGSINNMVIGDTTAKAGTFTALTATTSASLSPTGAVTINPGTTSSVDNVNIGATTAGTGKFTTLQATTSANFSPSGTVTINPTTQSNIDNVVIGATTAKAATFTSVTDTGLTSGRVTFAGTSGLLSDNSGFTFNSGTTTLTVTNASVGALTATTSASLSPSGSVTINPGTTSNVDNVIIGATTARAGTFTALTATTSASLSPPGTVTINPGTLSNVDNVNIGANTRGTGAFTTLTSNGATTFTAITESTTSSSGAVIISGGVGIAKNLNVGGNLDVTGTTTAESTFTASAAVNLNPANFSVSIQPTGTGTATINPAAVGAIDNMIIGANTPKAATFTTLTTQGNTTLNGSGSVISLTPTGSGYVTINPAALGTINNMSVGATTASTGKFTTLQATTSANLNTSGDVTIQPSGTVTIAPTTTGTVDNVNIGNSTRGTAKVSTLDANSTVTFTSSTQSTSTTTGAVQIAGGVGIVKNLYVGGDTSIAGNLTVLGTTTTIQSTVTTLTDPVIAVGGLTDTGLVDAANRGVQTRYARDISSQVTSWTSDGSSAVVANLSVTAASLGVKLGDKINISGSGKTNLDGIGTVTAVGSNTVTFTAPGLVTTGTTTNIATVGLSKNGFFGYEPTTNKFVYIPDATISSNVVTGNYGDAEFNSLTLVNALAVPQGGTGTTTFTSKGIVYGNGTGALQVTAASDMGGANATTSYAILTTDSSNNPVWTDVIDCGTY